MTSSRRVRAGLAAAVSVAVLGTAAGLVADSSAAPRRTFRQTAAAYTPRYDAPVAPGVDLAGYTSAVTGGAANSDVLTVDLSHPGVSVGILGGGSTVSQTQTMQSWAQSSKAVAAVNGDYFDIGASQSPVGPVVRGGAIKKGTKSGQPIVGQGTDGLIRQANVFLDGTLHWKGGAGSIDAYNSVLKAGTMPANGIAVLDGGWGAGAVEVRGTFKKVALVAVGANGKVISASKKLGKTVVPAHGFLVVGTGRYAGLAGLKKGTGVTKTISSHTDAPVPFTWGIGFGLQLMRAGSVIHNYPNDSDSHDARTILGWANGGKTMILVTVEAGGGSQGEGVNEMADELAAQGATDAVDLDGGGSTTLIQRPRGTDSRVQVGPVTNGGGVERRVPDGIGVFVPQGSGLLYGFQPQLDAGTVFPGLHRKLSYTAWDEWYGQASIDPSAVTVGTDNAGLLQADGPGKILALRPGSGHVTATTQTYAPGSPGTATAGTGVLRVLQPLAQLDTPGALRLTPGSAMSFQLVGEDATGATAPIIASDVTEAYDSSKLSVSNSSDGTLSISSRAPEGTVVPLTLTAAGVSSTIQVHVGFGTVQILDPSQQGALRVQNGKGQIVSLGHGVFGLKVSPGTKTVASAVANPAAPFPAGIVRLGVSLTGDGQRHAIGATYVDAGGHQHKLSLGTLTGKKSVRLEIGVPAGGRLVSISVAKGSDKKPGFATITQVVART